MNKLIILITVVLGVVACESKETKHNETPLVQTYMDSIKTDSINLFLKMADKFLIDEDIIKWRILEKDFRDTLRLYRNRIFAKYGYKFTSTDLQKYFSKMKWYRINPRYDNSLLTKKDSLTIVTIKKYEYLLQHISPDSLKILKRIFDFRRRLLIDGFDTTITKQYDITGDSQIDTFLTRITFIRESLKVENILLQNGEPIWKEISYVNPCLPYIDENDLILKNYPRYGYYYLLLKRFLSSLIPRITPVTGSKYVHRKIAGMDTSFEFGALSFSVADTSTRFKRYLFSFKGCEIYFSSAYCLYEPDIYYSVKIWDRITKQFVFLWSGP